MSSMSFKPKQATKKLLGALSPRAQDVLTKRYGLDTEAHSHTLEAIGQIYGITRERVRQIENHALHSIQKSDAYKEFKNLFEELETEVARLGHIIAEHELLEALGKDSSSKNHVFFLLTLGTPFTRSKEDDDFHHRWHTEPKVADMVEKALARMHESLSEDDLLSEEDMMKRFVENLDEAVARENDEATLYRWLGLSKRIAKNPLGEWGVASSPNVRAKGIRDFAYLAVKRHGSPMHFREVAKSIEELFARQAHVATCHNELIKDSRFVLVGRGMYGLKDWGHTGGVVRDVITEVLKEANRPLGKDEIIKRVLAKRIVKPNTVLVNLQNTKHFRKVAGDYTLI